MSHRAGYNAAMNRIHAVYHLDADSSAIEARAEALAAEQSVEMPPAAITDAYVRDEILARVEDIRPLAPGRFAVTLGIAAASTGPESGQLMNMLFGNCSLQEDVRLVEVELPPATRDAFVGPRYGLPGIRRLVQAENRALTMTALKPQGLGAEALGAL